MATTTYTFFLANTSTNLGRGSLTPVWSSLYYVTTSASVAVGVRPAISEVGGGWYKFDWDAVTNGAVAGVLDAGLATTPTADRYVSVLVDIPAGERADMAVQLLHNGRSGPHTGGGTETVSNRAGTAVLATYTRTDNGTTQTRVPNASL